MTTPDVARFALSVFGQDRPGIVAAVSRVLTSAGCNIEDSSMTVLRAAFAMLLVITARADAEPSLRRGLAEMAERESLTVHLDPYPEGEPHTVEGEGYFLSLHGADHPGIVAAVASLLADLGVNIVDLSTHVIQGQVPVYVMTMELVAPRRVDRSELEAKLEAISKEIDCAISVRPLETLGL